MTVNDLEIEKMIATDVAIVARLEKEHFSTPWNETALLDLIDTSDTLFWVGKINGKVVGYISRTHSFETMDILTVCVLPALRRKGVATRLLEHLHQEAMDLGVEKIFLEVRESNIKARALYEKHGYYLISKRKRYYSDPMEDALVLQKEILHQ